jgi:predicted nucleotide-binding protein (sugar kinase/HSP70/actin superfamily)
LPELKLTIDTIGKAQLIQAIEYYTPLINDILQKSNTKLDVNTIKEIVEKASSVTDETAGTVLKTIDVLVRGVLGIKLGGKVETG